MQIAASLAILLLLTCRYNSAIHSQHDLKLWQVSKYCWLKKWLWLCRTCISCKHFLSIDLEVEHFFVNRFHRPSAILYICGIFLVRSKHDRVFSYVKNLERACQLPCHDRFIVLQVLLCFCQNVFCQIDELSLYSLL